MYQELLSGDSQITYHGEIHVALYCLIAIYNQNTHITVQGRIMIMLGTKRRKDKIEG